MYNLKVKVRTTKAKFLVNKDILVSDMWNTTHSLLIKIFEIVGKYIKITISNYRKNYKICHSLRNLNFQNMNNNFRCEISPNIYQYLKLVGPLDQMGFMKILVVHIVSTKTSTKQAQIQNYREKLAKQLYSKTK